MGELDPKRFDKAEIAAIREFQSSPITFIKAMWGFIPQPLRPEYALEAKIGLTYTGKEWDEWCKTVRPSWFETFVKGSHITWQQWLILLSVEKALKEEVPRKITVVSGRGIGKSGTMAWLLLWFLYCFPDAQIPATAVTSGQLDDALWKEAAKWLDLMPPGVKAKYQWSSGYIRMTESPETWFARARTSSKDRPEALSGIHADYIMGLVDEASAIDEKVYEMGTGILTSGNAFLLMFSNGTRAEGYFYNSHHNNSGSYCCLSFDSLESPIVNMSFVQEIIGNYCFNVDPKDYDKITEWRENVRGLFPLEGTMDEKGYVPLLEPSDILYEIGEPEFVGARIMGVDCGGDGDDKTVWVVRDRVRAFVVAEELVSDEKSIANKTILLAHKYGIPLDSYRNIVVDGFGVGHKVGMEIAIQTKGKGHVTQVNTGNPCEMEGDRDTYLNQRAQAFMLSQEWLKHGGKVGTHEALKRDLLAIKYRRQGGRYQIEPKIDLKKRGVKSPDYADAFSMTFLRYMPSSTPTRSEEQIRVAEIIDRTFDRFSVIGE